jgi:hypothetical protein
MVRLICRSALLACVALASACYSTPTPECTFACSAATGGACPDGYTCRPDNVCKREGVADDFACPDIGGSPDGQIDSPIDADIDSPIDADIDAPIDAPDIDAPDIDAPIDAPDIDAPDIDAPDIDAPIDAPDIDAPIDAEPDA